MTAPGLVSRMVWLMFRCPTIVTSKFCNFASGVKMDRKIFGNSSGKQQSSGGSSNVPARSGGGESKLPASSNRRTEAVLQVTGGPDKGSEFVISRILTTLGRQEGCDIVLKESVISREHAQIEQTPEGYVYINLSENGSWMKGKGVDRALLVSGDSIEIGARTRMKFVLREVEVAQVGPVFKRRARRKDEEVEVVEKAGGEKKNQSLGGAGKSLMKNRKLVVGLGVYLGLMLVIFIVMGLGGSSGDGGNSNSGPLPYFENKQDLVPYLTFRFDYKPDESMAIQKARLGQSYYEQRTTRKGNLYLAVKSLQESQAYGGGHLSNEHIGTLSDARNELRDQIWQLYSDARMLAEVKGEYAKAREFYRAILLMISDPEEKKVNPLYNHIQRRMELLPAGR